MFGNLLRGGMQAFSGLGRAGGGLFGQGLNQGGGLFNQGARQGGGLLGEAKDETEDCSTKVQTILKSHQPGYKKLMKIVHSRKHAEWIILYSVLLIRVLSNVELKSNI